MKNPLFIQKKHYACEMYTSPTRKELLLKGIDSVKRDKLPIVRTTMRRYFVLLLQQNNAMAAFKLVLSMLSRIKRGCVSLTDIIQSKALSKPLREYNKTAPPPHVAAARRAFARDSNYECSANSRIPFVFVKPPHANAKVCEVAEDPNYVIETNSPINYDKYFETALSAVKRIITIVHDEAGYRNMVRQVSHLRPAQSNEKYHMLRAQSMENTTRYSTKCANPDCSTFIGQPGVCDKCRTTFFFNQHKDKKQDELNKAKQKEKEHWDVCSKCQNGDIETAKLCVARECPNYYPRQMASSKVEHLTIEYDLLE